MPKVRLKMVKLQQVLLWNGEEPSYFFRLSAYEDRLELYENNPDFVAPKSRLNEVRSFVSGGLNDLSVSRASFSWGVPVPGDDAHVMYVWLDALTNYMTAAGYAQDGEEQYAHRWPADLHMVQGDILRFHAVYWPAFFDGSGTAFAQAYLRMDGGQMKVRRFLNLLVTSHDPIEVAKTYGLDQMRYFLLREVPFGNDGDFSYTAMIHRMNGDLAERSWQSQPACLVDDL